MPHKTTVDAFRNGARPDKASVLFLGRNNRARKWGRRPLPIEIEIPRGRAGHIVVVASDCAPVSREFRPSEDEHVLTLSPPVHIPLAIWIVAGNADRQRRRALEGVLHALYTSEDERLGVTFTWTIRNSRTTLGRAPVGQPDLEWLEAEQAHAASNAINVYCVERVLVAGVHSTHRGVFSELEANFAIGSTGSDTLFTHELCHVLGLGHWGFEHDAVNIMHPGSIARRHLTAGQVCRVHFQRTPWRRRLGLAPTAVLSFPPRLDARAAAARGTDVGPALCGCAPDPRSKTNAAGPGQQQDVRQRRAAPRDLPSDEELRREGRRRWERRIRFLDEHARLFKQEELALLQAVTIDQFVADAVADYRAGEQSERMRRSGPWDEPLGADASAF